MYIKQSLVLASLPLLSLSSPLLDHVSTKRAAPHGGSPNRPVSLQTNITGTTFVNADIDAYNGGFYIGIPHNASISYCAPTDSDCHAVDSTSIVTGNSAATSPGDKAYLYTSSDKQLLYANASGALSYTNPGDDFPTSSIERYFRATRSQFLTKGGWSVNDGFWACKTRDGAKGSYQIFVDQVAGNMIVPTGHKEDCVKVQISTVGYYGPRPSQYNTTGSP